MLLEESLSFLESERGVNDEFASTIMEVEEDSVSLRTNDNLHTRSPASSQGRKRQEQAIRKPRRRREREGQGEERGWQSEVMMKKSAEDGLTS